jgi:hypothetical protein
MELAFFACLTGVVLYLARRLSVANTENVALRTQIALLKRQLGRARGHREPEQPGSCSGAEAECRVGPGGVPLMGCGPVF